MFMIELKTLQTNGSDRDGKWNVVHGLYPFIFFLSIFAIIILQTIFITWKLKR
jgi:hypothetical protein